MPDILQRSQFRNFLVSVCLLVLLLGFFSFIKQHNAKISHPGAHLGGADFVAYWSAYQVARSGSNPYSAEETLKIQKDISDEVVTSQLFFNPPWMLTALSPILVLDYSTSCALWFVCNLIMLVASGLLIGIGNPKLSPIKLLLLTLFFVPALEAVQLGQLSILILFLFVMFIHHFENRPLLSAICLALIGIKPQILLIALVFVGARLIVSREFKFVASVLIVFLGLLVATHLQFPNLFGYWEPQSQSPVFYKSATLSTWVRILFSSTQGYVVWPVYVVPLVGILIAGLYYLRAGRLPRISLRSLSPLLCVSVFFAPYGWIFDQSILLIIPIIMTCSFNWAFGYYMILQTVTYFSRYAVGSQHYYAWYPLAIGLPLLVEFFCSKEEGCDDSI
jgi:hypothetical protein